jgi:hypothetical protein
MQEDTAQLKVTFVVDLKGEAPQAEGQEYLTAETKAEVIKQILRDQKAAILGTYDTGVAVTGTVQYTGRVTNEPL